MLIRKFTTDDVEDCFAITSDPRALKMMAALPVHQTKEETRNYLNAMIAHYEENKAEWWAVVEKTTHKVIGVCGFVEYKPAFRRTELGYMIAYDEWDKGYATEAVQAVLSYGFSAMNLNRIEATVDPENSSSIRILENMGMRFEGLMRKRIICNGEPRDRRMYGILKTDWFEKKSAP